MKIIDVGVCTNNNDPKGIGRIRYVPYGIFKSEIEKSISYEEWDENDQFIAIPFLPAHVNVIPKVKQSIKLIKYDTDKDTQNVEYVSGPYSTPHDFGSETFTSQHKNTTYGGVIIKDLPDVRDSTGNYIDKKSEGTIAKLDDTGIYGNYGSDLIFTENGLVLRGGKLIDKSVENKKLSQRLRDVPLLSNKVSKISLKKFPKTLNVIEEIVPITKLSVSKINYLVEYEIDDLTTPTILKIYVYKILGSYGSKFDTNVFNETTELNLSDTTNFKLISLSGETVTTGITINSLQNGYVEMREFLHLIDQNNLVEINPQFPKENVHPFFFRPTKEFRIKKTTGQETINKNTFITNIQTRGIGTKNGSGLIFSLLSANAPTLTTPTKVETFKYDDKTGEQTFASVNSDLLYLLSTNVNKGPKKSIDFNSLNNYEYSQQDYLKGIDPNTYAVVRGDVLIDLIKLMYEHLVGHKHNINDSALFFPEKEDQLREMINKMEIDLVNQSIRIN